MSTYARNPEFTFDWPDFLPGPEDPRWKYLLLALALLLTGFLAWLGFFFIHLIIY